MKEQKQKTTANYGTTTPSGTTSSMYALHMGVADTGSPYNSCTERLCFLHLLSLFSRALPKPNGMHDSVTSIRNGLKISLIRPRLRISLSATPLLNIPGTIVMKKAERGNQNETAL